jgi:hypothetical protein
MFDELRNMSEKIEQRSILGVIEAALGDSKPLARQLSNRLDEEGNKMTTETLNFPVFHSKQGVETDDVKFAFERRVADLAKATDFELATAAAQGDMAAFEEVYKRHHRRVYSVCLRMLQNTSEAEDLTQDVFIQLYRKIGSFAGTRLLRPGCTE